MSKKHHHVRVLIYRAFAIFLTVFLISDVGRVYASRNLQIIAQQEEAQADAMRAEALKLTQEGLQLLFDEGSKESILAARKKFKAALILLEKLGDKKHQAFIISNIGRTYLELGENQKALQYYYQALALTRAVKDKNLEATTLNNIGLIYSNLGENQKALEYYKQALPISRAVEDKYGEASILNNIGGIYADLGENQEALQYYNQALPLRRLLEDKRGEATTLSNIGGIYADIGEKQKALQYYNQALPLTRAVKNRGGEATALNNIATVYLDLGENQKALQFYNQAKPLYRAVGDRSGEATTLNNIGKVYADLGEKQKALQYYNQALPLFRALGEKRGEANTLNNIGGIYSDLGENQKAVQYYNQALPLRRAIGDRSGEATTLSNIGKVYLDLGERHEALQNFNQALSLFRAVQNKGREATILNNIGKVYSDLGENKKALQYYNQALPLRRAVGDKGGEAHTFKNLAKLKRKQGNLQASLKHIEKAIAIIEQLRTTYTNQDLKTTYFSTVQNYYKFYIDLLMEQHKKNPSKAYDTIALHISERSRARGLIELLAQANAKLSKNVNPEFIAEEKELHLKREAQERIIVKLINQKQPPKDTIKQTEAEIQNIINQQKQLKVKIRAQNPERDKLTNPEPLKLSQIQQQLDKDTVLLQYSLGKERSYLWLVTSNSLDSYELASGEEIEKVAKEFHSGLSRKGFAINSAKKLSEVILKSVKDKLAGKRLVIVADGVLQQIPFAALHDLTYQPQNNKYSKQNQKDSSCGNSGGLRICDNNSSSNKINDYQPLMLNHEIVNLPSASTIAIQREKIAKRNIAPKKIAILADPVYSYNDKQDKGQEETRSTELELERSALQRSAKSLNRKLWGRIPDTATEAKAILKLVPKESSFSAFRFDANYNFATSKNLNQYQILHFATHGFVNPDQPELSGIVLSLFNKDGQQIPGYLRLADLFEQDYPAELIVLSACETGLGKNVSGEGIVGLTRGLMYAGASRVALSLWQVDDKGTSVLMQEFYKQMLQENKNPAEALTAAQRKLWANPDWRNPYYWAAFTLQGEWN
ncbi:TPR domain protein [Calothrix parasitica NIES-267]|uniref:TPR domain protein n=1 Tax=Calothrix parasitica NIES-267 TaxID=1973488 RepID=A0A1Z4LQG4_9CYAN|nr:TPR domain protein [Calothrix parasitica NIES-267]